jgi:hypothetical protein
MKPIVILGAGLSGLSCASYLHKAGKKVLVLEEKNSVGGRVASTRNERGFLLDEGFQVLLNSYPELSKLISLEQLELQSFNSGALIFDGVKLNLLANPFRHPRMVFKTLLNSIATVKDKILVVKLLLLAQRHKEDSPVGQTTTLTFLQEFGFSENFIEFFWRPFLTGVYLDPDLSVGSNFFQFLIRCFGWGEVSLPKKGMVELPIQISKNIPMESLRLGTKVRSWTANEVFLENGEKIEARKVICAFDSTPEVNEAGKENFRRVITHYFTSPRLSSLGWEKWLILIPRKLGIKISHMALLSSVAETYGSDGAPLLSVSIVGEEKVSLESVKKEIEKVAGKPLELELVGTTEVRKALPIIQKETKGIETCAGVLYCGDRWASPSINGALRSGRLAAETIIAS